MKKIIAILSVFILLLVFVFSCGTQNAASGGKKTNEFVARNSDFDGWRTWPVINKTNDTSMLAGSGSHLSRQAGAWRWVYMKNNAKKNAEGQYSVGTMIVKEYRKANGDTISTFYTAMVKRGNDFNPEAGNWEWFHIDPITLKIRVAAGGVNAEYRGTNIFNNSCSNCHKKVASNDYVFSGK